MSSTLLLGFIAASLVVLVLPGPGVLYVVARSLSQGRRAGLVSALGLSIGALVHVVAAAAGLSAILLTSATAFGFVKLLGAGYLIYLGIRTLLARHTNTSGQTSAPRSLSSLFTDGVVVSALNPKIAVFFLAFLPQFIDPNQGQAAPQIVFLGLIYAVLALLTDGTYAVLAGNLRNWLGGKLTMGSWPRYASGCVYIGLGVTTALAERPR